MYRSADRRRAGARSTDRPARRAVPPSVVLLLALGVLAPAAGAEEAPAGDAVPLPPVDLVTPTPDVVAPVVDLQLATSDLKGAARIEEHEDRIDVTLSSEVLFGKDSAKLRDRAVSRLEDVADRLAEAGPGPLTITGYTDDLGSAQHGLALSRQRARAVARALRPMLQVADYPFTVRGRGEADPAVPNSSEANRRLNRRVEIGYHPG